MGHKKGLKEVERARSGRRCRLGDLYWLACHGQPVPTGARPAVLFAREWLGEPYSWVSALQEMLDLQSASDGGVGKA